MQDASGQKWFGRGFVPGEYKAPDKNQQFKRDVYDPWYRFKVKVGEKRHVVFLDALEDGMRFVEHFGIVDLSDYNPAQNRFGKKINFPCLKSLGKPCWLCDSKCPATRSLALSVIDVDGYTSRKGELVTNIKKLFIIYERELPFFNDKSASINGLKASVWRVGRYNKQGTTLGDDYSVVTADTVVNNQITHPWVSKNWISKGRVTKAWVTDNKIEDPKPFDYMKEIPFEMTADDQQRMFASNPNWTWDKAKKEAAQGGANVGGGAAAAAPAGGGNVAPAGGGAPPAGGSEPVVEEDIPF